MNRILPLGCLLRLLLVVSLCWSFRAYAQAVTPSGNFTVNGSVWEMAYPTTVSTLLTADVTFPVSSAPSVAAFRFSYKNKAGGLSSVDIPLRGSGKFRNSDGSFEIGLVNLSGYTSDVADTVTANSVVYITQRAGSNVVIVGDVSDLYTTGKLEMSLNSASIVTSVPVDKGAKVMQASAQELSFNSTDTAAVIHLGLYEASLHVDMAEINPPHNFQWRYGEWDDSGSTALSVAIAYVNSLNTWLRLAKDYNLKLALAFFAPSTTPGFSESARLDGTNTQARVVDWQGATAGQPSLSVYIGNPVPDIIQPSVVSYQVDAIKDFLSLVEGLDYYKLNEHSLIRFANYNGQKVLPIYSAAWLAAWRVFKNDPSALLLVPAGVPAYAGLTTSTATETQRSEFNGWVSEIYANYLEAIANGVAESQAANSNYAGFIHFVERDKATPEYGNDIFKIAGAVTGSMNHIDHFTLEYTSLGYPDSMALYESVQDTYLAKVSMFTNLTKYNSMANLESNGGFETVSSGVPSNWGPFGSTSAYTTAIARENEIHSGLYSVKVNFHGTADVTYSGQIAQAITATPGKTYNFVGTVKLQDITGNYSVGIRANIFKLDHTTLSRSVNTALLKGITVWNTLAASFTLAADEDYVVLELYRRGGEGVVSGTVYLDNLFLQPRVTPAQAIDLYGNAYTFWKTAASRGWDGLEMYNLGMMSRRRDFYNKRRTELWDACREYFSFPNPSASAIAAVNQFEDDNGYPRTGLRRPTDMSTHAGSNYITLTWTPAVGASGYTISYGTASGVYTNTVNVSAVNSTTISGLTNGTTYYFKITAINGGGTLGAASEVSAQPTPNVPGKPQNVQSIPLGPYSQGVTWEPVYGATSYMVKLGSISGTYTESRSVKIPNVTISSEDYLSSKYLVVTAVNAIGESVASAETKFSPGLLYEQQFVTPNGVVPSGWIGASDPLCTALTNSNKLVLHVEQTSAWTRSAKARFTDRTFSLSPQRLRFGVTTDTGGIANSEAALELRDSTGNIIEFAVNGAGTVRYRLKDGSYDSGYVSLGTYGGGRLSRLELEATALGVTFVMDGKQVGTVAHAFSNTSGYVPTVIGRGGSTGVFEVVVDQFTVTIGNPELLYLTEFVGSNAQLLSFWSNASVSPSTASIQNEAMGFVIQQSVAWGNRAEATYSGALFQLDANDLNLDAVLTPGATANQVRVGIKLADSVNSANYIQVFKTAYGNLIYRIKDGAYDSGEVAVTTSALPDGRVRLAVNLSGLKLYFGGVLVADVARTFTSISNTRLSLSAISGVAGTLAASADAIRVSRTPAKLAYRNDFTGLDGSLIFGWSDISLTGSSTVIQSSKLINTIVQTAAWGRSSIARLDSVPVSFATKAVRVDARVDTGATPDNRCVLRIESETTPASYSFEAVKTGYGNVLYRVIDGAYDSGYITVVASTGPGKLSLEISASAMKVYYNDTLCGTITRAFSQNSGYKLQLKGISGATGNLSTNFDDLLITQ